MPDEYKNFRPMIFTVVVPMGPGLGNTGENSVSVNDRPFIIKEIHHQITNPDVVAAMPAVTDVQQAQDGLYRINWSLYNQRRYFQGVPPMADAAFGSIRHGIWIPLSVPVAIEKNRTLNVQVTNMLDRSPTLTKLYQVEVQFHGLEDIRNARDE